MKQNLKNLSEIVANANDIFYERNKNTDTLMGIMDKTLREQGMQADAITIDCVSIDKKIVLVLHDSKADFVDIALGDKAGAINSSTEHLLAEISTEQIVEMMEQYFIS
ncbi:hypothetical protein [Colwellia echini]|uniref:DUF302 domain-containing protein n=1 Tax=Colwellia echini TaxID=1982103 RepID=A0ABY3MUE9_9GAMM|nr:hypothetical protein [Colwellia echini]TYK64835.1 hypothetical protein CWS31_013520 [Colwellia echini]